jgi:hypothetical protein
MLSVVMLNVDMLSAVMLNLVKRRKKLYKTSPGQI